MAELMREQSVSGVLAVDIDQDSICLRIVGPLLGALILNDFASLVAALVEDNIDAKLPTHFVNENHRRADLRLLVNSVSGIGDRRLEFF